MFGVHLIVDQIGAAMIYPLALQGVLVRGGREPTSRRTRKGRSQSLGDENMEPAD